MNPELRENTQLAEVDDIKKSSNKAFWPWFLRSHSPPSYGKKFLYEIDKELVSVLHELVRNQIEPREERFYEVEVQAPANRYKELELENGRLKTRVAELQRSLNREIQRFDQGSTRFDDVLGLLHEANKANNALQAVLIARTDGRLRMFETYDGVVKQADDEEIVVLFEIEDELIEQTYKREQFVGGRLPSPSDRFTVYVHGALLPRIEKEKEYNPPLTRVENGETRKPRKFDTGPLEV